MDRVEVLRGPQGTLYGANTLNGVVRILTNDADPSAFEFKARTSLTSVRDGDEGSRVDAALNIPLIHDRLAVRGVVGYQDVGGWIDSPVKSDLNDATIRNYRLKMDGSISEALSMGLSFWRFDGDLGGYNISEENRKTHIIADESSHSRYDVYGAKLEYHLPAVTITSMTSYIDYVNSGALDASGGTSTSILVDSDFSSETLSQELLISSNHRGPWRWSAGFFYRDSEDYSAFDLAFLSPQLTAFTDKSESYAFFGELSRKFLGDALEFTVGARRFHDSVDGISNSTFFGPPPESQSFKFNATTPRALLTWKPQRNLTFYASYSEGFRSGLGQNTFALAAAPDLPSVRPDKLHNYEVGAKGTVLDGKLAYESSFYFEDWKDSQQVLIILIQPNVGIPQLVNSESVSGWGGDFALTAELLRGLTVGATFAWNDLAFDADVFSGGTLLFDKGSRPSSSAEYTAGASVDYSCDLGSSGLTGVFSVSGNYTSELQNTFTVGPDRYTAVGDSQLIARASLSIESANGWRGSLFGDNLTDENGLVAPGNPPLLGFGSRPRPRTFGVQLEYRFGRD